MSQCQFITAIYGECPSSAHPRTLQEEIEGKEKFCTHHQQVTAAKLYYNGKEKSEEDGQST